jgi:hypothetical protein
MRERLLALDVARDGVVGPDVATVPSIWAVVYVNARMTWSLADIN